VRGRVPRVVIVLTVAVFAVIGYAALGAFDVVPWRATDGATVASAAWLLLAGIGLLVGMIRVMSPAYATSRRNAHRIALRAPVSIDGVAGELADVSIGGAAVRFPAGAAPSADLFDLTLPGAPSVRMVAVRTVRDASGQFDVLSMRLAIGDWAGFRTMSLWLFHTPPGAVDGMPEGVPAVAATRSRRTARVLGDLITEQPTRTAAG